MLFNNNRNQAIRPEIRGTWIPLTNSIQSKTSLVKTIARVQELNLNTVYVNTFSKGVFSPGASLQKCENELIIIPNTNPFLF